MRCSIGVILLVRGKRVQGIGFRFYGLEFEAEGAGFEMRGKGTKRVQANFDIYRSTLNRKHAIWLNRTYRAPQ